jgi:DNA primase
VSDDARRIREALADPARVAALLGLEGIKRQPGGVLARCPAHEEKHASLSLTLGAEGTLRVKCFGCGLSGDVYALIAAVERLDVKQDFRRVFLRACELAGETPDRTPGDGMAPPTRAPSPRAPSLPRRDPSAVDTFARVVALLLDAGGLDGPRSREVAAYLDTRGLLDAARGDGWGSLPSFAWARSHVDAADLAGTGLVLPSGSGWTHPAHTLCVPWRSADGSIFTLQRRRIDDATGERYVMPPGRAPRELYGIERLAHAPADAPIAICEGAADVLAVRLLASRRGRSVVALGLPGAASWAPSWASLARGRRCFVSLDSDDAGERASVAIAADLAAAGAAEVKRHRAPDGAKDWAALLGRR